MDKINFNFKNRTAIVTGGAQGFGLDIAKRFLNSGAKVIIWDIDTKMLEKDIQENPEFWIWTHKRWKREKVKDLHAFKEQQREKFNKRYRSN